MDRSVARKRKGILPFVTYIVAFYGIWALSRFLILPFLENFFPPILQGIIDIFAEMLIFIIPVLLYLRVEHTTSIWSYLKLNTLGKGFFWSLLCMLALFEMAISTVVYFHHRINIPYLLRPDIILLVLLVGVTEEIPFRGFLLQELQPFFGSWGALVLSALFFAGIHLPTWLLYPPAVPLPFAIAGMTFLGIILGIVVRKTNSLWSAILIHSCYDLAVILVTSAVR